MEIKLSKKTIMLKDDKLRLPLFIELHPDKKSFYGFNISINGILSVDDLNFLNKNITTIINAGKNNI